MSEPAGNDASNGAAAPEEAPAVNKKATIDLSGLPMPDLAAMPTAAAQAAEIADAVACCGNCEHYVGNPKAVAAPGQQPRFGWCHKRAPTTLAVRYAMVQEPHPTMPNAAGRTLLVLENVDGFMPPTNANLKCGDHERKANPGVMDINTKTEGRPQ